jgi:hypothetical protein
VVGGRLPDCMGHASARLHCAVHCYSMISHGFRGVRCVFRQHIRILNIRCMQKPVEGSGPLGEQCVWRNPAGAQKSLRG